MAKRKGVRAPTPPRPAAGTTNHATGATPEAPSARPDRNPGHATPGHVPNEVNGVTSSAPLGSTLPPTADTASHAREPTLRPVVVTALLGAALLVLLPGPPAGFPYPLLYDAGRLLLGLGLGLGLASHLGLFARLGPGTRDDGSDTTSRLSFAPTRVLPWALLLVVIGLGGIVGRAEASFRLFGHVRSAELGIPVELAFLALALGLHRAAAGATDRATRVILALGTAWGGLGLLGPEPHLEGTLTAFGEAFRSGPLPAVAALTLALALLAGLLTLGSLVLGRGSPRRTRSLAMTPALVAVGLLAPIAASPSLAALAFALALLACAALAHAFLAARDRDAPDGQAFPALERVILVGILGIWLLLKSHALIASNTDENIYFYMAKLLSNGKWPYVDYFFAHPPLHVLVPGVAFSVFGFSLTFAKLFPMVATLLGGLAVWGLARRAFSPFAAPLALVLYLFATEVLKASSNMTGVNMTTMWLLLGTWQSWKDHPLRAGLLLGAAPATGFYAMAPALAVLTLSFFRGANGREGIRSGLRHLAGFALVFGTLNAVFWVLGGDTFRTGVYDYHTQKFFQDQDMVELFGGSIGFPESLFHNLGVLWRGDSFAKELFYHPHLWLAGMLLPVTILGGWLAPQKVSPSGAAASRRLVEILFPNRLFRVGPDGYALALGLVILALFVEFAMFRELYSFYFVLIYPFLALAAAYVLTRGLDLLAGEASGVARPTRLSTTPAGSAWRLAPATLGLAGVIALGSYDTLAAAEQPVFDDELGVIGARNDYDWTPAPVLAGLSDVTRALFWSDRRMKGDLEPGYRHYLWTKKRGFSRLDEVAAYIRDRSRPDETLAGSSTLAPLVALLAERRIAADEIDTNNKRFKTGILKERDYWQAICRDQVRFLVASPRSYFTQQKLDAMPLVRRYFAPPVVFEDNAIQYRQPFPIALYQRLGDAPCAWSE